MKVRIALLLACLLAPLPALASGGDYPTAVFVHEYNPPDLQSFYGSDLGILRPTYRGRHLVIAWRRMAGLGVTESEAKLLAHTPAEMDPAGVTAAGLAVWKKSREKLGLADVNTETDITAGDYAWRANCSGDAFVRASARLDELVAAHGAGDPDVREWLKGQDAVFTNCSAKGEMPGPLPPTAPEWLQRERSYQTTAVLYYREKYREAAEGFERLAVQSGDPLAPLAAYLALRSRVRLAEQSVEVGDEGSEPEVGPEARELYEEALTAINAAKARDASGPWHTAVVRLEGQLEAQLYPRQRVRVLDAALLAPRLSENAWQDLWDYVLLAPAWGPDASIYQWVSNFQAHDHPEALAKARAEWKRTGKQAWLLAALMHAAAAKADASDLIAASNAVPKSSPAFLSLAYYRVRALEAAGRNSEARAQVRELLSAVTAEGSARNLLLDEAAALAESPQAFADVAVEKVVSIEYPGSEGGYEGSPARWNDDPFMKWRPELRSGDLSYFSPATAAVINGGFTAAQLRALMQARAWPEQIRRDLTITLFTRALLLDRLAEADDLAGELQPFFPESRELLDEFRQEKSAERRRFLATLFVLRTPGADVLVAEGLGRLNPPDKIGMVETQRWWRVESLCTARAGMQWDWERETCKARDLTAVVTPAGAELEQMARQGAPATFAGRVVLAWARGHENDPHVPEALHLVVRASRYGDVDCNTARQSQQAFALLGRRFKGTEWQKQTPSWFGTRGGCRPGG